MRPSRLTGRRALLSAAGVGVLAVVLIAVLAARSAPPSAVVPTRLIGKLAPPAAGTSVESGKHLSLSTYRGRFVVLDFFASWCIPCEREAPELAAFAFAHRSEDVSVLGVVVNDSAHNAAVFLRSTGASWPAIADANGEIALDYGVDDPPQVFLISPSGRVAAHIDGAPSERLLDVTLAEARAVDA